MARAITELQDQVIVQAQVIRDVELANGVETPIAHRLGRPATAWISTVRGASGNGRVEDTSRESSKYPRRRFVVLRAHGYSTTITVDLIIT